MRILFVDDDEKVLAMIRRNLGSRFRIETFTAPAEALASLRLGPAAVVVADLRMPGMDGFEFLSRLSDQSPLTVKIMLTGHADLEAAISGVNEGRLFRFLTKPCNTDTLARSLEAALEQYRLVTAEKELLRGTLQGSIKVLTDILAQVNPEAFGRSERLKRHVKDVVARLGLKDTWKYELAAMLSQIGCIFIPEDVVRKSRTGQLTAKEREIFATHPAVGAELLSNIPRLEDVREIVQFQEESLAAAPKQPKGARILKICLDYDGLESRGLTPLDAVAQMKRRDGVYDKAVLEAFERHVLAGSDVRPISVTLAQLREGMILGEDLVSEDGRLLLAKGLEVNAHSLLRLRYVSETQAVREPFVVLVPMEG
jgi:response regulator RpfG family c-di-GMP phosphodiesterase